MEGRQRIRNRKSQSGNSLIEFSLAAIPILFTTLTIVLTSIAMWQLHCLAYASEMTANYASVHGATCAQNGNNCTVTIGDMAFYFTSNALALNQHNVSVSFKDGSGTTSCNPLISCASNSTQFPASSNNKVGSDVTVSVSYTLMNPIPLYAHNFTLSAMSRQRILF
jgi:Flp pilus assembly protein TadG